MNCSTRRNAGPMLDARRGFGKFITTVLLCANDRNA